MTDANSNPRSHPIDPASLAALPRTSGVYIFRGEGAFRLRRSRTLCTIRLSQEAGAIMPLVVSGRDVHIGQVDGLFGLQVRTCLGACIGKEDRRAHDQRLCTALKDMQVHAWPFTGAIDLVEQSGNWIQRHRIQNWCYQGTWCSRSQQRSQHSQQTFDLDTYKILVKPIMMGTARVEPTR